jgi:tRNA-specific 2-thiouridylase
MSSKPRVVVAMSGGVDSSVAAALLKQRGYEVIGLMLRLWSEPGAEGSNRCCTPDSMAQARRVAAILETPFYAVDAQETFHDNVVRYFIDGYAQGLTPNPCLVCNRQIRWTFLLERSLALGAQFMATGHYARVRQTPQGRFELLKALDESKDQSYVLHVLDQERLSHALFPLGPYTKAHVRELARQFGLPVAERPESQDLCFLGHGDYREFLLRNAPGVIKPGAILNTEGQQVGEHQGLAFYTIGQRKGLGIASSEPLYVVDKDTSRNALIVGKTADLGKTELIAAPMHWVSGDAPVAPFRAQVKIRYKAPEALAWITPLANQQIHVTLDQPLRDITPGQAAVLYDDQVCLGGGIIQS